MLQAYENCRERDAAEPRPIHATDAQQRAIPAELARQLRSVALLSDQTLPLRTATTQAQVRKGRFDCWPATSLVSDEHHLDIPRRLRLELLVANEVPGQQVDPGVASVTMVKQRELDRHFAASGDGWARFEARFPGSTRFERATRAVISADGNHAGSVIPHICGGHCDRGGIACLHHDDGAWKLVTHDNP